VPPGATGGGITEITSADSSVTITNPDGPITDLSVTVAAGIDQITGDVTAGPGSGSQAATLAATANVIAIVAAHSAVSTVFGRAGAVVAAANDYSVGQVSGAAPLASPALTGVPTAPTAAPGTNTTQLSTTGFVHAAIAAIGPSGIDQLTGDISAGPGSGSQAAEIAAIQGVNLAITSLTSGDVLGFNGTDWINTPGGGSSLTGYIEGPGDPITINPTTPAYAGILYVDTTGESGGGWISVGSAAGDWLAFGAAAPSGGGGLTVQTSGVELSSPDGSNAILQLSPGGFTFLQGTGGTVILDTSSVGLVIDQSGTSGINIDATGVAGNGPGGGTGPLALTSAGGITFNETSATGINIDATGASTGTGLLNLNSAGGLNLTDNSTTGINIAQNGTGGIELSTAAGGLLLLNGLGGLNLFDNSTTGITLDESGTGGINITGAGGVAVTDNSATGISIQSSAGPVEINDGFGDNITMNASTGLDINVANSISIIDNNAFGITIAENNPAGPITLSSTLLGFYNVTGVAQPAAITAPSGGAVIDVQARAAIVSILAVLGKAAGGVGLTA
jgi:hypothetical protein